MTKNLNIKNQNIVNLITDLEAGIRSIYKNEVKKIILFGSYARGNYEDDSDVDIMVLLNKNEFERYSDELVDLIVELTGKYSVLPSIMVEFEKEYRENIDLQSLYRNIENEGIELYNSDQRRNSPTFERYINSNF